MESPSPSTESIVNDTGVVAHHATPADEHRFSIGATFLGWAVAAFFTLVFVALVGALIGAPDTSAIDGAVLAGLVGYFVATFAAYVIGGYAAGRIALWDGVKHGMLTVAWAVLFAILFVVAGSTLLADTGFDVSVPLDVADITLAGVIASVLTLAAMLGGAALGGSLGERYHRRVHGLEPTRRRTTRTRGRPL